NLDEGILIEALKSVPYASFLAAILSQQDHSSLVMLGLHATELLVSRLDEIYRYQLYREGVMAEITKLAADDEEDTSISVPKTSSVEESKSEAPASADSDDRSENEVSEGEEDEDRGTSDDENEDGDGTFPNNDDGSGSPVSSR